jgi:2-phosphosulfolactate phosphatase
MEIRWINHDTAEQGQGIVIVIDVIRAFSVAAYAFAGGAAELWLVREVEEALGLRDLEPAALLAGEVGGRKIPGFDFSNSPAQMSEADVRSRIIIQRTGAGTRGAISARKAAVLLACSLVNARATADYVGRLVEERNRVVSLYPTATISGEAVDANEDEYCADYLAALLLGSTDADSVLQTSIENLFSRDRFQLFHLGYPDCPPEDVASVLAVNRFSFVMQGQRQQRQGIDYVRLSRIDPLRPR